MKNDIERIIQDSVAYCIVYRNRLNQDSQALKSHARLLSAEIDNLSSKLAGSGVELPLHAKEFLNPNYVADYVESALTEITEVRDEY